MELYKEDFDDLIEKQKITNVRNKRGEYVPAPDVRTVHSESAIEMFLIQHNASMKMSDCNCGASFDVTQACYVKPNPNTYMYALECTDCGNRTKFYGNPRHSLKDWQQSKTFQMAQKVGDNQRFGMMIQWESDYQLPIEEEIVEEVDGWCC
jgi:hypothetical protein